MVNEITSGTILSEEQLKHHLKIYAGPGAGKTHFLVENVKSIISSNSRIVRSKERKVLCVTYTNAAVNEIKRRLEDYAAHAEVFTIHSFIIEYIIKPFQQDLINIMASDFNMVIPRHGLISSQVEGLGILHGVDKENIYEYIRYNTNHVKGNESFNYSKKIMGEIEVDNQAFVNSKFNENSYKPLIKHSERIPIDHALAIKSYVWSIIRKLTHNEILYFGYRILETNPIALYALRVKFPFIFVDEFQDTNPLQTMMIKMIGQKSSIICVVGDIAQSIYSFQGAKPSDFQRFEIKQSMGLAEYVIKGNRRSTHNIVEFCNCLRQSDETVIQESIKQYKNSEEKELSENKKIHLLVGNSQNTKNCIHEVLNDNGVVLTRTWADAFNYIEGIDDAQIGSLKKVYNSYYSSPIQIRDEIMKHNNVTWVRAFKFIMLLWNSYCTKSLSEALLGIKLYSENYLEKLNAKVILQLKNILNDIFCNVTDDSMTCDVIGKFNDNLADKKYSELNDLFFTPGFSIPIFDEQDNEKLRSSILSLRWDTSYKLFTEVFSESSKYMTVHQAKGLEWKKVIVSVKPTRNDKITIEQMFRNPQLIAEGLEDEFTRIYYVACSRAIEDLYLHVTDVIEAKTITDAIDKYCSMSNKTILYEIIK